MDNNLEKLKKKIYHPEGGKELEERLKRPEKAAEKKEKAKGKWEKPSAGKKRFQLPTWGLLAIVIFLGLALIGYGFWQWAKFRPQKVHITMEGLSEAPAAEIISIKTSIKNNNRQTLHNAQLHIKLPPLTYLEDRKSFTEEEIIPLGNIEAGGRKTITKKIRLFAPIYQDVKIKGRLNFKVNQKEVSRSTSLTMQISSSPLKISIKKPRRLVQGQSLFYQIFYKNTGDFEFPSSQLKLLPPSGFRIDFTDPAPINQTTWPLGTLSPGEEGKITVKGALLKEINRAHFRAFIESKFQDKYISYAQASLLQPVSPPALAVRQTINKVDVVWSSTKTAPPTNKQELEQGLAGRKKINLTPLENIKAANLGQVYKVMLEIENTTETVFKDIIVTTDLRGELLEPSWVVTERLGQISPNNRHISWTKERMIPQEKDEFGFYVGLKNSLPLSIYEDENTFSSQAKIDARVFPEGWEGIKIGSENLVTLKLGTEVDLAAKIAPRDAPMYSQGPIPPVIKKETTYALVWELSNTYNDIEDIQVESSLPENVRWAENYFPSEENIEYNSLKNKITWDIDKLSYGTGHLSEPRQVYFQVILTPQPDDYGKQVKLLNQTNLSCKDTFTEDKITTQADAVETATRVRR